MTLRILLVLLLTGCTAVEKEVASDIENRLQEQSDLEREYEQWVQRKEQGRFSVDKRPYLAPIILQKETAREIPHEWQTGINQLTVPAGDIRDAALVLRSVFQLPVIVNDKPRGRPDLAEQRLLKASIGEQAGGVGLSSSFGDNASRARDDLIVVASAFKVSGSISDIIEQVAAQFGVDWRVADGRLIFDVYVTESFVFPNASGTIQYETDVSTDNGNGSQGGVSGGSTGISSGSGSTQTASPNGSASVAYDADFHLFEDIERLLFETVLPASGTVTIAPSLSNITVTAPSWAMPEVRKFMKTQQRRLSRQLALEVSIFSIDVDKETGFGAGLDLLFTDLHNDFGFSFRGSAGVSTAEGSTLEGAILSSNNGSLAEFAGSRAVLNALRRFGDVATHYNTTKILKHQVPGLFTTTNQTGYIASRPVVAVEGAVQRAVQPGVVVTGFLMSLQPNILDDGTFTLQTRLGVSELVSIQQAGSGDDAIGVPQVNSNDELSETYLASGEMVILTGFEQIVNRQQTSNGGFGGCAIFCTSKSAESATRKFFIVLRGVLIEPPSPSESRRLLGVM